MTVAAKSRCVIVGAPSFSAAAAYRLLSWSAYFPFPGLDYLVFFVLFFFRRPEGAHRNGISVQVDRKPVPVQGRTSTEASKLTMTLPRGGFFLFELIAMLGTINIPWLEPFWEELGNLDLTVPWITLVAESRCTVHLGVGQSCLEERLLSERGQHGATHVCRTL